MEDTNRSNGMSGLALIRGAVGLSGYKLAELAGLRQSNISRMETGAIQECLSGTLIKLAGVLCCTVDDLLSVPTPERLLEIKAAYHQREADRAKAEAAAAERKPASTRKRKPAGEAVAS